MIIWMRFIQENDVKAKFRCVIDCVHTIQQNWTDSDGIESQFTILY